MAYRVPTAKEEQTQLQFRLSSVNKERLMKEAQRRAVSVNLLVERACVEALGRWEKQKLT